MHCESDMSSLIQSDLKNDNRLSSCVLLWVKGAVVLWLNVVKHHVSQARIQQGVLPPVVHVDIENATVQQKTFDELSEANFMSSLKEHDVALFENRKNEHMVDMRYAR